MSGTNRSNVLGMAITGAAGAVAGFMAGRRGSSSALKKQLNGNQKWMTKQERDLAAALISSGRQYLFRNWPAPGVRDAEKRALLTALSSHLSSGGAPVEPLRLAALQAPLANKVPHVLSTHGHDRTDNYYWLRDDARKNKRVLEHLSSENAYTKAVMADTESLQEVLYKEMRGRIQEADQSVPERRGGYYYYSRTLEGQQYRMYCRRRVPPGAKPVDEKDNMDESQPEEVLLDENLRKEQGGHTFYSVGCFEVSPDHKLLAWSEDTVGNERYTLRVKNLESGAEVMAAIPQTSGDVEWAADNQHLFYVVKDHLDRPYKVLRHEVGRPASEDVVVHEEKDESFYVGIHKSHSEEYVFISSGSAVTAESRFIRASEPTSDFKVVLPRVNDVEYSVSHRGQYFYITLRDKERPNSELLVAPTMLFEGGVGALEGQAVASALRVLLPHSKEDKLEHVSVSRDYLAVFKRSGGLQRATVFKLPADGSAPASLSAESGKEVTFEEPAYSLGGGTCGDFDSSVLRLSYTSLTTPSSTIDYNMATGARAVKKVQPVLGGFNKDMYVTERQWAVSHDGVKVPVSIVYRKGAVKLDGNDPLLLNGYGSYEISNDPYFNANRLCLLDRGFVFAMAHIRGGGEMGRYWYEDGKYLKKKNTFHDFIAAAEHLVARKYTSPAKLCIEGRSAGGLLMGAVTNMRPDLFSACIAGVPFVDALTTMLDETIPLTVIEWEEWGNPANKDYYDYMLSYSPQDNIREGATYPHMLVTGGLHDPRVAYWEPAKFVAKLRELSNPKNMLLLKMEMGAGHFSVTGRFERLKEIAFEYAFLLKAQGMTHTPATPSRGAVSSASGAPGATGSTTSRL